MHNYHQGQKGLGWGASRPTLLNVGPGLGRLHQDLCGSLRKTNFWACSWRFSLALGEIMGILFFLLLPSHYFAASFWGGGRGAPLTVPIWRRTQCKASWAEKLFSGEPPPKDVPQTCLGAHSNGTISTDGSANHHAQ